MWTFPNAHPDALRFSNRPRKRDAARLQSHGFVVIHFWNTEILDECDNTLQRLHAALQDASPNDPTRQGVLK
ncbi:MAG TPA: DUF559 domain-containing protein [Tahibacter sp.]|uniref:DUF559 domain-containing protein n=1 Tax=Tahibacter sp. TaxID=2056211 RepID=UPI002B529A4C|nr:DUF559 domain-containing protein [Tahibacter sp.]HSX61878.1 DUF559 domain-containing protein [Tahibacter sp.]